MSRPGKSPARIEAERYAAETIGALDPMSGPIDAITLARAMADAYEAGRVALTRGDLLDRAARARYEYTTAELENPLPYDDLPEADRGEIVASTRDMLDTATRLASTPTGGGKQ